MKKLLLAIAIILISWLFFVLLSMIAISLGHTGKSIVAVIALTSVFSSAGFILSALRPQAEPAQDRTIVTIQGNTITITRG